MGTINKYSNLYNKNNEIIKSVNDKGILTDYSIKELEELVDNLPDGIEKNNAMSMLQDMYTKPKTEEDKAYVKELREELLKKLMDSKPTVSTDKEKIIKSLGEVEKEITNEQEDNSNVLRINGSEDAVKEIVENIDKTVVDNVEDEYVEPISETEPEENVVCSGGIMDQIKDNNSTITNQNCVEYFDSYENAIKSNNVKYIDNLNVEKQELLKRVYSVI